VHFFPLLFLLISDGNPNKSFCVCVLSPCSFPVSLELVSALGLSLVEKADVYIVGDFDVGWQRYV
jgi:hypothetical protein